MPRKKNETMVAKFGGSATTSKQALLNIKNICKNKQRKIFVFSAIGKTESDNTKLTDHLINLSSTPNKFEKEQIFKKLFALTQISNVKIPLKKMLNKFYKTFNKTKQADFLISRGEYLTTLIMSKYLNIKFVPAEKIIFFKENDFDEEKISLAINRFLKRYKQICVPGFYGINLDKSIHLLSRGGSDTSGAILAKCFNAEIYENFTDQNGIFEVSPEICTSNQITEMTYTDLLTMTNYDAKVIHHDCAKVLSNLDTKLVVRNIQNLNSSPTIVSKNSNSKNCFVVYKKLKTLYEIFVNNLGKTSTIVVNENPIETIKKIYSKINNTNKN